MRQRITRWKYEDENDTPTEAKVGEAEWIHYTNDKDVHIHISRNEINNYGSKPDISTEKTLRELRNELEDDE